MRKKYEFTGETKQVSSVVVRQIRRLSDGKVGGWIEKEENLSHDGECWVSDNAVVFGNAVVSGDAEIFDNAQVYGGAWVTDNAWVFGGATVSDKAWVSGNARIFDSATITGNAVITGNIQVSGRSQISCTPITAFLGRDPILVDDNNLVTIGCEQHSLEHWLKHYKEIGAEHDYTKAEIKRYGYFLRGL